MKLPFKRFFNPPKCIDCRHVGKITDYPHCKRPHRLTGVPLYDESCWIERNWGGLFYFFSYDRCGAYARFFEPKDPTK